MTLFIPITKVDAAQRLVYGTISEEIADKAGEILDYESSKPAFRQWTEQFLEASGGKSLGNVRAMHGNIAAGKLTDLSFDDENKRIEGVAKVVDEDTWNKVLEGVYTGFSIGGGYAKRWPDPKNPALMRYTPTLSEVSLVDNPAVPTATFSLIKHDGSMEQKNFIKNTEKQNECGNEEPIQWALDALKNLLPELSDEKMLEHAHVLIAFLEGNDAEEITAAADKMAKLHTAIERLNKRVEQLENIPEPPRGLLRAVMKSDDYAFPQNKEAIEYLPQEKRAQVMIKRALENPQSL